MQRVAIARANAHQEITLGREEMDTIAEAFNLRCIAGGIGVSYDITFVPLRENRPSVQIRGGIELCEWCGGVVTPSNRSVHEAHSPFAAVPLGKQAWGRR